VSIELANSLLRAIAKALHEDRRRILISAYPGFGKTRLIPYIAVLLKDVIGVDKVLILTRSVAEVDELCRFFKESLKNIRAVPLVGRERLCPYGARSSSTCSILRDRGTCPLVRTRSTPCNRHHESLTVDDVIQLARLYNTCPYDLSISLAMQSDIVVSTITYLSNKALYENLMKIIEDKCIGTIFDEAHAVIQGLESRTDTSIDIEKVLNIELDDGEHIIIKNPRLDIDRIRKNLRVEDENLINILFSDVLYVWKRDHRYVIHGLTISTLQDLLKRSRAVIFLSASITREFANFFPILRDFYKIYIEEPPKYIENLRIFIVPDVEFKESFKYTKRCIKYVIDIIEKVIPSLPLVGGIMILFSSKRFMNHVLRDVESCLRRLEISYIVYNDDVDSREVISSFKEIALSERCVLITYAGSPLCEGVNFIGDELVSIMMFGFPFPEFSYWNMWKTNYLYRDSYFLLGFIYVAISITIQIVGRCMRDLDKRVKNVFLIDKRFLKYRKYFPRWFPKINVVRAGELAETFDYL